MNQLLSGRSFEKTLHSGAATCRKGFVKCFLRVPQAVRLYCSCHAAQASKVNFQITKHFLQVADPDCSTQVWIFLGNLELREPQTAGANKKARVFTHFLSHKSTLLRKIGLVFDLIEEFAHLYHPVARKGCSAFVAEGRRPWMWSRGSSRSPTSARRTSSGPGSGRPHSR